MDERSLQWGFDHSLESPAMTPDTFACFLADCVERFAALALAH
jgi:hypothetical protein